MKYGDFSNNIKTATLSGAYLLYGAEEYIKDLAIEAVTDKYVPNGLSDINYSKMDGSECELHDIKNAIRTLPFMSQYRVVTVSDLKLFKITPAQIKQNSSLEKIKLFEDMIIKCPKETILLFMQRGNVNAVFVKLFKNIKADIEFKAPTALQKEKYLLAMAKKKNLVISLYNIKMLLNYTSMQLTALDLELDKLKAYVGDTEVKEDDIYKVCTSGTEYDVFAMLKNITNKNGAQAVSIYRKLIFSGQSPQSIISMIERQFRALFYIDEIKKSDDKDYKKIAVKLNTKDFVIRNMERLANSLPKKRRDDIVSWCADADYLVKRGKISIDNSAELLIMKLIDL